MLPIIHKLFYSALALFFGAGFYFLLSPSAAGDLLLSLGFLPDNFIIIFLGSLVLSGFALGLFYLTGGALPRWQWLHLGGLIGCFSLGFISLIPQLLLFGIIYSTALMLAPLVPAAAYAGGELRWR